MAERRRTVVRPQAAFDEQIISDEELLSELTQYLDNQEEHKTWLKAKAAIKIKMKDRGEGTYRCGQFILEVKQREGGGISIPRWKANVTTVTPIE